MEDEDKLMEGEDQFVKKNQYAILIKSAFERNLSKK